MWPSILAIILFVIHSTSAKRVCDNPLTRVGMKYARHRFDCSWYVSCFRKAPVHPVYRRCDFGFFFDYKRFQCLPSQYVDCLEDKCKKPGVKHYKYADPNKCNAYYKCINGRAYASCCPEGQGYKVGVGCVPAPKCKSMCPLRDRVPGCKSRPIARSPTNYERYIREGVWEKTRCPPGNAYKPVDCECSITGLIKTGRVCKPDLVLNFNNGVISDSSGNNNAVSWKGVRLVNDTAYFDTRSKIMIEKLRPSQYDEGVLVIKMRYKELHHYGVINKMQGLVTNGHCKKRQRPSVLIAKQRQFVMLGCDARKDLQVNTRSFPLATIAKEWKEVVYIKSENRLEGRVCGATANKWAGGTLVDTGCGFQIGGIDGMTGYYGYLDDISIYRCTPLDAVINMNY